MGLKLWEGDVMIISGAKLYYIFKTESELNGLKKSNWVLISEQEKRSWDDSAEYLSRLVLHEKPKTK